MYQLRKLRKKKGFGLHKLAAAAGTHFVTVNRHERMLHISAGAVYRYALALRCNVWELFLEEDELCTP